MDDEYKERIEDHKVVFLVKEQSRAASEEEVRSIPMERRKVKKERFERV